MNISILTLLIFMGHMAPCRAFVKHRPNNQLHLTIDGLDCRKPKRVQSGLIQNLCKPLNAGNHKEPEQVILLQRSTTRILDAIRCERKITRLTALCGAFSHIKIDQALDVLINDPIPANDCRKAADQQIFTKRDGTAIPIDLNRVYDYKYIEHGGISHTTTNIQCKGSKLFINGELRENIVTFVTARVVIHSIKVEIDDTNNKIIDLDLQVPMSESCLNSPKCNDEAGYSYVIRRPNKEHCSLHMIRTLPMQRVPLHTNKGIKTALVNHEHKVLLTMEEGEEPAGAGCAPLYSVQKTNFPDIKVVINHDTKPSAATQLQAASRYTQYINVMASDVSMDLEIRTSEDYLAYHFETLLKTQMNHVGQKLCNLNQNGFASMEISPFHANSLIKILGDLVQEIQCDPVKLDVRIGEKRSENCYTNSLPVWQSNEPVFVSSMTHLVTDVTTLDHVACDSMFLPLFATNEGKIVRANPVVEIVDISLQHLDSDYLHLVDNNDVIHQEYSQDLIYSSAEIDRYNALVHFERTKTKIMGALTAKYCSGSTDCGAFKPSQSSSTFSLDNLKDNLESEFNWLSKIKESLIQIGSYTSIVIACYFILGFTYKICTVIHLKFTKKVPLNQAVRFTLFLNTQIRDALMHPDDSVPVPSTARDVESETTPLHEMMQPKLAANSNLAKQPALASTATNQYPQTVQPTAPRPQSPPAYQWLN